MALSKSIFLCILVVVASTVLQAAQANTVLLGGTRDTLPQRHLLDNSGPPSGQGSGQSCPVALPGIGDGPVAAKTVTKGDQKCFIRVIEDQWEAANELVPSLSAKLSRMQFHDAAAGHQDASLALNEEETMFPRNANVRGITALKLFKDRIVEYCGCTISWADTLVLATAIAYQRSGGPSMASVVPLGRADSATKDCCLDNLPGAADSADKQLESYKKIFEKYSAGDVLRLMVTLTGAHSLGTVNCRIARTSATAPADIDPRFLAQLNQTCGAESLSSCPTPRFPLDSTSKKFDNKYFKNVIQKRGVLVSDHALFYPGTCVEGVCTDQLMSAYAKHKGLFFKNFKWAYCHLSILGTSLTCPPSLTFKDPKPVGKVPKPAGKVPKPVGKVPKPEHY